MATSSHQARFWSKFCRGQCLSMCAARNRAPPGPSGTCSGARGNALRRPGSRSFGEDLRAVRCAQASCSVEDP